MPICIVFSSHTVEESVLFVDFFSVGLCVCWVVSATPLTACAYILVESETGVDDLGFSKWIEQIQGKPGLWDFAIACHFIDVIVGVCFHIGQLQVNNTCFC